MPLVIHFLNVGHGDCTFVEHPSGRLTMVDVNNSKSLPGNDVDALASSKRMSISEFRTSALGPIVEGVRKSWEEYYRSLLVDPYDYYTQHFEGRSIFRYIQSHPDIDHMSGVHRFFWDAGVTLENFWDTDNTKSLDEEDFAEGDRRYLDWLVYRMLRQGRRRDEDSSHRVLNLLRGASAQFYDEDEISILSPTQSLVDKCNQAGVSNNLSYVLRIEHAGRRVILPGDAEDWAWQEVVDEILDEDLECDVLKAAHHGRESGFHDQAVKAMNPSIVLCSVGKKPETDASDEYAAYGADVFSTRFHGSMRLEISDYGDITLYDRNSTEIAGA